MKRILVANRGEIAVRILRTAQDQGYETVALFSDADESSRHVAMADQAVRIGPSAASESYLDAQRILDAAAKTNADAIHPGYGFLSENAEFARRVVAAGLVWIGPAPESMEVMGNKARAKAAVADVNVPLIPGYFGDDQSTVAFAKAADEIGYPVMVKAADGGGGRGMRQVACPDDLADAIARAKSESLQAFGSDELLLEKAVVNARHIEVQIFGDQHGQIVHLGERDCSIQRRHQKVIEEAPSPAVSESLRASMGQAAIAVAEAVNYQNAGTVEFLLSETGDFYFMEMNTRLQVEHPVTEMVTGLDLVAWQLLVAEGRPLPLNQSQITLSGHAIEARLYAETPDNDFLPSIGTIRHWQAPMGDGVRVDDSLQSGTEITPYYDAMIAKLITSGSDREIARRRMARALRNTVVLGVDTNRRFLLDTVANPVFSAGDATTSFIEKFWQPRSDSVSTESAVLAAVVLYLQSHSGDADLSRWSTRPTTCRFSADMAFPLVRVQATDGAVNVIAVTNGEQTCQVRIESCGNRRLRYELDGVLKIAWFSVDDRTVWLQHGSETVSLTDALLAPVESADSQSSGRVVAPMPGSVLSIKVVAGESVRKGDTLLILEAMKMEQSIVSDTDGTITEILVAPGQQMKPHELMMVITPGERPISQPLG